MSDAENANAIDIDIDIDGGHNPVGEGARLKWHLMRLPA